MAKPLSKERGYGPQRCGRPERYDSFSSGEYEQRQESGNDDDKTRKIQVPKPRSS